MLFGHNTNVKVGATTYHVQTEDRGVAVALIDTTVYYQGRVMHRRTNNYHDLLPLNPDREEALHLRLNEQHRSTLEDVRSNALNLVAPTAPVAAAPESVAPAASAAVLPALIPPAPAPGSSTGNHSSTQPATPALLKLELLNARNWLSGKQARLEIAVHQATGEPLPGAKVTARIEGAATADEHSGETDAAGTTEILFAMPRLSGGEAALVIEARHNHSQDPSQNAVYAKIRFALRTKPRPA
jgi:hypothetical protein